MTETMRERMARAVFEIRTKRQHGAPDPWLEMTPMGKLQYFTIVDAILDVLADSEANWELLGEIEMQSGPETPAQAIWTMAITAIREGK